MIRSDTERAGPPVETMRRVLLTLLIAFALWETFSRVFTVEVGPGAEFSGRMVLGATGAAAALAFVWTLGRYWFASTAAGLTAFIVAGILGHLGFAAASRPGQGLATVLLIAAVAVLASATLAKTQWRRFVCGAATGMLFGLAAVAAPQLALVGPLVIVAILPALLLAPKPRGGSARAVVDDDLPCHGAVAMAIAMAVGGAAIAGLTAWVLAADLGVTSDLVRYQFMRHDQILTERARVLASPPGWEWFYLPAREVPVVRKFVPEPGDQIAATAGVGAVFAAQTEAFLSGAVLSMRALLAGGGLLMVPALFALPGVFARANRTVEDRRLCVTALVVLAAAISSGLLGPGLAFYSAVAVLLPALVFAHIARSI